VCPFGALGEAVESPQVLLKPLLNKQFGVKAGCPACGISIAYRIEPQGSQEHF
jgi:hypothetical protein